MFEKTGKSCFNNPSFLDEFLSAFSLNETHSAVATEGGSAGPYDYISNGALEGINLPLIEKTYPLLVALSPLLGALFPNMNLSIMCFYGNLNIIKILKFWLLNANTSIDL